MPDGEDKLIAVAMHIVLVAPMVGTEPLALAEATGFPIQMLERVAARMRGAGLWIGSLVDHLEWEQESDDRRMFYIFMHAQVAAGLCTREETHTRKGRDGCRR